MSLDDKWLQTSDHLEEHLEVEDNDFTTFDEDNQENHPQEDLLNMLYGDKEEEPWSICTDALIYGFEAQDVHVQDAKIHKKSTTNLIEDDHQDRYHHVQAKLTEERNLNTEVCTTYIRSAEDAVFDNNGNILLKCSYENRNTIPGNVPILQGKFVHTDTDIKILVDTGASKSVVQRNSLPEDGQDRIYKIHPIHLRVANGTIVTITEAVTMAVEIQGHEFEIKAYVATGSTYPLTIGAKAMHELEAKLDFEKEELILRNRTRQVQLKCMDKRIKPFEITSMEGTISGPTIHEGNAVAKLRYKYQGFWMVYPTTMVHIKENKVHVKLHNTQRKSFDAKGMELYLDMRSLGYFHQTMDSITSLPDQDLYLLSTEDSAQLIQECMEKQMNQQDTQNSQNNRDNYPWLDKEDARRTMTDREIIDKYIDLSESKLSEKAKQHFRDVLFKYRAAFSLRDEIGTCPDLKINLQLHDTSPFYIRPFPCKEEHKDIIDREMRKGVKLGILRKGLCAYSSPIMLIPRKNSNIPRIVTDFRHLNTRLVKLNPSIPLVRDAIQILGASKCEVISVVDLRDAYHTLPLDESSKQFCGITPYSGSPTYIYQRLGMGLSVSPAIWQNFITKVLDNLPDRKHHMAIMDDCLVHSSYKSHEWHLVNLFKALIDNGLKISPRKCQFYRHELTYMGHQILIRDKRPCITPMKTRIDAILKLNQPRTPKDCKSFCGMVNFLGMYLKDLQITAAPIYNLTRKSVPFVWTAIHQDAFEKIKQLVTEAPVLGMPDSTGLFQLYSDTSKIGCGAALYQQQTDEHGHKKQVLLGYASKKLPERCGRYGITELELTGMVINITQFKYILMNVYFEVYVDHSAIKYIVKSKEEPKTVKIQRLLEICSRYNFDVIYMKGKDMCIADFLSRHPDNDTSEPGEIIPIAFAQIEDHQVTTRAMAKKAAAQTTDTKLLQQPVVKLDKIAVPVKETTQPKQQETSCSRPARGNQIRNVPVCMQHTTPGEHAERHTIRDILNPQVLDIVGRSPHEHSYDDDIPDMVIRGADHKTYPLDTKDVKITRKKLPRSGEIKTLLQQLKASHLQSFHLPVEYQSLVADYSKSPFYGNIYKYVKTGYVAPGQNQKAMERMTQLYEIINDLLFKVRFHYSSNEPYLVLCIPEKYANLILHQYHDFMLAGHQGIKRTEMTIKEKFDIPYMHNYVAKYIATCQLCQERQDMNDTPAATFARVPISFRPMERMSMDVKYMPRGQDNFSKLLVMVCEITNWCITACMEKDDAPTVFQALMNKVVCVYGAPKVIVTDQGSPLTSNVALEMYKGLGVKPKWITPGNHGSNRAERYIRTLGDRIRTYLTGTGYDWPLFAGPCAFAMNTFVSPHTGFSPYEMVFIRKPPPLSTLEFNLDPRKVRASEYLQMMHKQANLIRRILEAERRRQQEWQRRNEELQHINNKKISSGDLVMFKRSSVPALETSLKSVTRKWIGPMQVISVQGPTKFVLADILSRVQPCVFHRNEIKPYSFRDTETDETVINVITDMSHLLQYFKRNPEDKRLHDFEKLEKTYTAARAV